MNGTMTKNTLHARNSSVIGKYVCHPDVQFSDLR